MKIATIGRWILEISLPPAIVLVLHFARLIFLPLEMWMDTIAHFSGGAAIAWSAANAYRLLSRSKRLPILPAWFQWFVCIVSAEFVGVVWEFYECIFLSWNPAFGVTYADTMSDLTMDLFGAFIVATVLIFVRNRKK